MDVPDVDAWHQARDSEAGITAMDCDGLRRHTIVELAEV
jgi:hypothetical protein